MAQSNPDTSAPPISAPPLVLVAEDHDDNRIIATSVLRHAGFRVLEAVRGDDAVRLAREQRPAVILMDVAMPGMDGLTATEQLKSDPTTANIIVLIVTAHALPSDREMATKVGSDGFLTKPVSPTHLVSAVKNALDRFGN